MKLSRNFTLSEMVKSQSAIRRGIDNTPNDKVIEKLKNTAIHILQPVRDHFNTAFVPTSGYRCLELNRAIGSKDTSQHIKGEAVDFEVPGVSNYDLAKWIEANLAFDQLILEYYDSGHPNSGWVHCSFKTHGNRGQAITINHNGVKVGLIK